MLRDYLTQLACEVCSCKKLPVLKTAAGWSQPLTDVQVLSYSISTWLSTKLHTIVFDHYLQVIQVKNNKQWQ